MKLDWVSVHRVKSVDDKGVESESLMIRGSYTLIDEDGDEVRKEITLRRSDTSAAAADFLSVVENATDEARTAKLAALAAAKVAAP